MDKNELDHDNPIKQADELKAPVQEISLLPRGCETPEGAMRVKKAMDAWEPTHAEVANVATRFFDTYGGHIAKALKDHAYDVDGALADLEELQELIRDRAEKQNEFLKAMCGIE